MKRTAIVRAALYLLPYLAAESIAGELRAAENAVMKASKSVRPTVVTVITPNARDSDQTGVVVAQGGVILTTRHLLLRGGHVPKTVPVRFPGKDKIIIAEVLADDEGTDTVVLRAKGARVKPISIGRSDDAQQGMWVLLVGQTPGHGRESTPTVSLGVISNIVRDNDGPLWFHASALVNPGSVGSPLVDLSGDLVGLVTARRTPAGGQSIVLPFDRVRRAYRSRAPAVAKLLGRRPPPRAWRAHVADALGPVIQDAVRRASKAVVGVRAGGVQKGEKVAAAVEYPKGMSDKDKKRFDEYQKRITPRLVPGALAGHDRASGVVVGADGWILAPLRATGWPGPLRKLTVDFMDGARLRAKIVGTDERLRIALLKVKAKGLPVLEPAPARGLAAGSFVVALGFPHGSPGQAAPQSTFGVVSRTKALARLHPALSAVQTDAAVSGGNRGGPLIDLDGRLVGYLMDVNDTERTGYFGRVRARYGENTGLGFAIPTDVMAKFLPKLMAGGNFASGFLGISGVPTKKGILVQNVVESNSKGDPTTAKAAGLKVGDIVVSVGGAPTRSIEELRRALAQYASGDQVEFVYLRDGKETRVTAQLSAR